MKLKHLEGAITASTSTCFGRPDMKPTGDHWIRGQEALAAARQDVEEVLAEAEISRRAARVEGQGSAFDAVRLMWQDTFPARRPVAVDAFELFEAWLSNQVRRS